MPVRAVCPECGATTSLDDDSPKRSVECSQCGSRVAVPGAKPAGGPPPAPANGPPPAAAAGFDVVDDEEDEEGLDESGRPAVGRRSRRDEEDDEDRPRRRRDEEDEEDEDDDRPRRSARARDEEDDEDDEDDRPRRGARARDEGDEDDDEEDRPRRSARARDEDEDEDEEDDEDDRPRRAARAHDDEDDEEEDEDRPRGARRGRDDEDDEEEEDEEERPRRAARSRADEDEEEDEEEESPRRGPRDRADADEDEEEEEAPRRGARGRAEDDEDDEDDDKARSRSRPARAAAGGAPKRHWPSDEDDEEDRKERDEEEDEDDRPRRRPAAQKKPGVPVLLIVGLLAFVLVGIGGGAAAYFLFWGGGDDKTVVKNEDDNAPPVPPPGPVKPGPVQPAPAPPPPAGPLAIRPANFDAIKDKPAIPLPGKVTDACAGAGGRFVFFHCGAEKKLVVFDVSALAAVKEIPTSGPTTFIAAGATRLILADRDAKTVRRWDLVKMEQDKEAPLPFDGQLAALSLGAESDGPALMAGTPGPSGESIRFLDLDTLGPAAVGWAGLPGTVGPDVRVRAAGNGSHWVALTTAAGRPRTMVLTRAGNRIGWQATTGVAPPYAALSADGSILYSPAGPSPIGARPGKSASAPGPDVWLPALHGPFCLHSRPRGETATADVRARDVAQPLGTVSALPPPAPNDPLTPDQHTFFIPDARAIVLLAPERDHLTVTPFDIPATLAKAGRPAVYVTSTPPTTFTPGRPFEYTIRTYASSPNLRYTVIGPPGVTISPDGRVRWDVPANLPDDRVSVLLTASVPGATGSQSFGLFNAAVPAPKAPPVKKPEDKSKDPTPKSPEPKVPAVVGSSKLVNPVAARLPITPAEMPAQHAEVAVPGQIRDLCVAGGGRYLILHCPTARKLAVFDVSALKVVRTISLNADEVLFAAGMEKLAVVYPDEKLVIRYSLATFKPEADATLDVRQKPTAAAMGSATAGPLILGGIPAQANASKMLLMFVDLDTLTEVPIAKAEGDFKVTFGSAAHLRASADGRTLGAWFAQLQPSGLQIARLDGNAIGGSYRPETVGHVTPGPDGQTVYTEKGLFSAKGEPLGRKEPAVPAVHGGGFLTVTDVPTGEAARQPAGAKRVTVWEPGRAAPAATFDGLPGFDGKHDPFERDNPLPLDKRLLLVPEAGILVVVPPTADKLHVYKVEAAKGEPKKGG